MAKKAEQLKVGDYVHCVKEGIESYGVVLHKRISQFNNHQEVCSIQTKSGVYSQTVFDIISVLSEKVVKKLKYSDLNSAKHSNKKTKKLALRAGV